MAGGDSRRMGQDKLRMHLPTGEQLIDRPAAALRELCEYLFCVGPDLSVLPTLGRFQLLADAVTPQSPAGSGPVAGLVAALEKAEQIAGVHWVLALAGDLPLVEAKHLKPLMEQAENHPGNAVLPVSDHGMEPLLAAYPVSFAPAARTHLQSGKHSLKGFLSEQPWIALSGKDSDTIRACFNLNRPEDWESLPGIADPE